MVENTDDLIDSRKVIDRIIYLESLVDPDEEDTSELATLKALAEEGANYAEDWSYGATLIRDSYFRTYAEDLAADMGLIQDNAGWPYTCIDWPRAARELQFDYHTVEFGGVTYWVR